MIETKIKKPIIILSSIALVVVILSTAYFSLLLPLLNVLYNPAKANDNNQQATIIQHGGDVLDKDDPFHRDNAKDVTPDPDATVNPNPTEYIPGPVATPDPDSTPDPNPEEQLADSIFILNINEKTKVMKLISVPRDTYVPHAKATQEAMKKYHYYNLPGSHKINACVYIGSTVINYVGGKFGNSGIDYMCAVLSALLPGCEIDDYVYVDFYGFMDIVDIAGGVYVTSPENMYTVEGELAIRQGRYKLTAREALFYVRSRYRLKPNGENTGTGGDNFRKINQANFITEVATQLFTKENMTLSKVTGYMEVLKQSVFHSITPAKLSTYLPIGVDFANKEYKVVSYVIAGKEIDPFGDHASYVTLD